MTIPRLSADTLTPDVLHRPGVSGPLIDPEDLSIGIVHFGIGAFHRAHQAVFTEDAAAASGDSRWGILGVTGRSEAVVQQLRPQDCLYGVLERGADATQLRLIGSVRDVAWPARDSERVVEALAAAHVHLATLTITEKGYLRAPGGGIDLGLDAVQHDVGLIERELAGEVGLPASSTPIGLLVRGLARRFRTGGAPFTVVPCDNLVDNGPTTRRLVHSLVDALGPAGGSATGTASDAAAGFREWLEASVRFPSTMVDRIAPATTEADREAAAALLGLRDEALVVAEPFKQWVIEDDFAGPRPAWEKAGAILTTDVAAYERVKLRILNGAHSMLAYLGALKGHETIAQTVADAPLRQAVLSVLNADILPAIQAPEGIDLAEYRDSVLARFANPSLAHTTRQVAMDGSQKLPFRWLASAADRLRVGHVPEGLAFALAAWATYIASTADASGPVLDDPLASRLQDAVGSAESLAADPAAAVDRLFAIHEVFSEPVAASAEFRAAVVAALPEVRALLS